MNLRPAYLRAAPAVLTLLAVFAAPAARAVDVGVSINFAQPGVYGQVDIGRFPAPALIAPQPIIAPAPVVIGVPRPVVVAPPEPMYLWVPPGHREHWNRYCGQYHACGRPVYFVRDDWYNDKVMKHGMPPGQARKMDRGDYGDDGDRGHGKGHGHGHGKD